MGCRKGCGNDANKIELIVKDLIRQMIEAGQLQEGLVDCGDRRLRRDNRVLACDQVKDAFCQMLDSGDLCLVLPERIIVKETGHVCLLMSDGTENCSLTTLKDVKLQSYKVNGFTAKAIMSDGTDGPTLDLTDAFNSVTWSITTAPNGDVTMTKPGAAPVTIPAIRVKAAKAGDGTVTITNQDGSQVTIDPVRQGDRGPAGRDGAKGPRGEQGPPGPVDMGKNFEKGGKEAGKWNVKHDDTIITKADGTLSVVPPGCHRITNLDTMAGLPAGDGMYCIYGNNSPNAVLRGAPIMQDSSADTQNRQTEDTTTQDHDWNGVAIRANTQVTVYYNAGSATWMSTNDSPDMAANDWSVWRRVENMPTPPASTGLDCAAIAALPKKAWSKGTTVLARGADGRCHQLSALDSIFQEVGVGITASKLSGLTNEKYHVVVTVSNTGEGTNDLTNLVITKPLLGSYTTSNFTTSKAGATAITRGSDDFNYTITGLTKGGTAKVEFDVTPTSVGTFQFQASVNPNSALDQQSNNNTATVTLSATTNVDPNYVASVDCPVVSITYNGKELIQCTTRDDSVYQHRNNFFMDKPSGNLVLKVRGVSTVYAQVADGGECCTRFLNDTHIIKNERWIITNHTTRPQGSSVHPSRSLYQAIEGITLVGDTLTIKNVERFAPSGVGLLVRPTGSNCRWQAYTLVFPLALTQGDTANLSVRGLDRSRYVITDVRKVGGSVVEPVSPSDLVDCAVFGTITSVAGNNCATYTQVRTDKRVVVTLPAGTAYDFTITGATEKPSTTGKTTVTPTTDGVRVKVAATAKATDSVTFGNVVINITE